VPESGNSGQGEAAEYIFCVSGDAGCVGASERVVVVSNDACGVLCVW